ncbi:MAG: UDP-N-acetylmuramoyl-L-alanine--D-glutamate ligase [Planctomycetes bacterium]|nr:UDP-N-acetylmuramoyl-L-alanine--D-glutamate ligase [Planctomycetota bacterium]
MASRRLFTPEVYRPEDLKGRHVTVMGLGLFGGGRGLTEFLCRAGARVLVTDLKDAAALRPSIEALRGFPIEWALGRHRDEDFLQADLVFVNPAVPRGSEILERCLRKGIPLETEMNLFFKLCRGRICGITGSNGKTTTASLTAEMVRRDFPSARLGGNLGVSLLNEAAAIQAADWTILELSSFQLEDLRSISRRPDIALITNLSPNHLNRHRTYEDYLAAKRVILEGEDPQSWAILNGDDPGARGWAGTVRRQVTFFGRGTGILPRSRGVWAVDGAVIFASGPRREKLFDQKDLALVGRFNLVNAAGAAAAALAVGCSGAAVAAGARGFRAIEHRLEFVCRREGVDFFNDSKATTPESALNAIDALGPDLILVAGGSDKGSPFRRLGYAIARRTRGAVLLGETAPKIREAIRQAHGAVPVVEARTLEEAVQGARKLARPGFRVALSPACASYDMFTNFEERGRRFKEIVQRLGPLD